MHNGHPKIVAAEILPNGLLVTFEDQRAALFSPEQLERIRIAAEQLLEAELFDAAVRQLQEERSASNGQLHGDES
jgi:hypothetical protein